MDKVRHHSKRVLIGIVGGLVVLIGLVLVPYPGPGWLIIFAGLAILANEFTFAQKTLDYTRGKYNSWVRWLKKQNIFVQLVMVALTGIIIIVTVYILNGFGILNALLGLNQDWLVSPLFD